MFYCVLKQSFGVTALKAILFLGKCGLFCYLAKVTQEDQFEQALHMAKLMQLRMVWPW